MGVSFCHGHAEMTLHFLSGFKSDPILSLMIIISSPEHEVLKVSYCDRSMSVMRCLSSVVRRPSCSINNLL